MVVGGREGVGGRRPAWRNTAVPDVPQGSDRELLEPPSCAAPRAPPAPAPPLSHPLSRKRRGACCCCCRRRRCCCCGGFCCCCGGGGCCPWSHLGGRSEEVGESAHHARDARLDESADHARALRLAGRRRARLHEPQQAEAELVQRRTRDAGEGGERGVPAEGMSGGGGGGGGGGYFRRARYTLSFFRFWKTFNKAPL